MTVKTLDLDQAIFFIYPDMSVLKEKNPCCSSAKELLTASLREIRDFLNCDDEYKDYFWHDEGIHWELMEKSSHPFISGKIKFGDGMEDEWFMLKLLLKLSSNDAALIASIFDTDGDFILIEAAEVLPEWLEPETSKNRVFIHEGSIKIIPMELQRDQLQLHEALKFIRAGKSEVNLNLKIMKGIESKLLEEQKLHKAKVCIPLDVGTVLKIKRQLIGPVVSSFYNREPGLLKLSKFKDQPTFITTIPMTRIQFAQLACQELEGVDLDLMKFDHPIAAELGLKLTLGFEILMSSESRFIEKFNDSTSSVQSVIQTILSENDKKESISNEWINDESEDSLDWMEIDENVLDSNLQSKLEQLSMSEMEQAELIDTWTREFEEGNGRESGTKLKEGILEIDEIVEKMKNMIESKSSFEGIENYEDNEDSEYTDDTEDNDDSTYSDDSEKDFNSENDEELIEREIFEAINFDPDLLMKIVEANAQAGASNEEFLARFRKYQEENPGRTASTIGRQKGLADIEGVKVEEARKSSRKVFNEPGEECEEEEERAFVDEDIDEMAADVQINRTITGTDYNDEDDEEEEEVTDEFIYGQTFNQFKRSSFNTELSIASESEDEKENEKEENAKATPGPSYDSDIPECMSINEYYSVMDKELCGSLLAASPDSKLPANLNDPEMQTNLGKNLIESMAAGRGTLSITPIETVLTGLGKKIPNPRL